MPPTPEPEPAPARRRRGEDVWRDRIPKIQGTELSIPSDVIYDGLVAKGQQWPIVINGKTIEPLELPVYLLVRKGEIAYISKTTGRFMIGEDHTAIFQFLIDQLGEDKMQLLATDYYENMWGSLRGKYVK